MSRILLALSLCTALLGSAHASTIYSFDGSIDRGAFPDGTAAGWNDGDEIHGSFVWDPANAYALGSCWGGAISSFTISSASSVVMPTTSGDSLITCASSSGLFIESELQSVQGSVIPPGVLDVLDFVFAGSAVTGTLPVDLSLFGPGRFDFQWLHPDIGLSGSVTLESHAVPEPSTIALLLIGAVGLTLARRAPARRKRSS